MGSETGLWKTFKKNLSSYGEFDRHEDKLNLGVPDISYKMYRGAGGWIELKYLDRYPARPDTIFRIEHFTREQRIGLGTWGDIAPQAVSGWRAGAIWPEIADYLAQPQAISAY